MKDIKNYAIGFLSATCLFLIMGHSNPNLNANFDKLEVDELIVKSITLEDEYGLTTLTGTGIEIVNKNLDNKIRCDVSGFMYSGTYRTYFLSNMGLSGYLKNNDDFLNMFSLQVETEGGTLIMNNAKGNLASALGSSEQLGMFTLFNEDGLARMQVLPTAITAY